MKIATKNPQFLIDEIIEKITSKTIKTWIYQDNLFFHKGKQYSNHIYFSYSINNPKSIIEFTLHSDENTFAKSRGFDLLEGMLLRHFKHKIEILKNN